MDEKGTTHSDVKNVSTKGTAFLEHNLHIETSEKPNGLWQRLTEWLYARLQKNI